MESGSKYIVFDDGLVDSAVIFSRHFSHDNMAMAISKLGGHHPESPKPISAGFVQIMDDGTIQAYGESTSLKLRSRPEIDSKIITKMIRSR